MVHETNSDKYKRFMSNYDDMVNQWLDTQESIKVLEQKLNSERALLSMQDNKAKEFYAKAMDYGSRE